MLEFEQKKTFLGEESGVQELQEFRSSGVQEFKRCGDEVSRVESSPKVRSDKH
jgi:hypothetical protein